ncbi:MAG: phosphoadenosine phosphosulfate reductase family protein [Aphanocapsa sp. GSE-SYN-MK-11-07L]|jgi:3'-phosphoadenosine 5'-phosphosulfate sulfotransferase (PAPS reductase)/FAD synthetase|nr:phosphoadenosine phosphosulfate reductase family protein [Aphanocapsa sp. GSE-SYN-MK-11-07L]
MSATQLDLFALPKITPDFSSYDTILVAFSGGKDSICCVLHLLEMNINPAKVELHHHLVDGREGSDLFDWPCTEDYCRKFAEALELKIYFSWLQGGLEREMCRENQSKAPTHFETPEGIRSIGGQGQPGTRRKFPAKTADLSRRWCSAYAKIDVLSAAIANQPRFTHCRTLVVTGERAEESSARAKYPSLERHRCDRRDSPKLKRHIDHWRPVHHWRRSQVWQTIRQWGIVPHPAYFLGFGRLSCMRCIFGSPNQWSSNFAIAPGQTGRMHEYEQDFGHTLDNRWSIPEMAARGKPYAAIALHPVELKQALSHKYTNAILIEPKKWRLPAGAYGEDTGPT